MPYPTQFPAWLSLAAQDGRGGLSAAPPTIVRGSPASFRLDLNAHPTFGDWTGGTFSAVIKASPDASGSALATWVISVGTPAGGVTPVTFTLAGDAQGSIPADTDGDGVTEMFMQIDFTPTAGSATAILQTRVLFVGAI